MKNQPDKCENCGAKLGDRVFGLISKKKKIRNFCSANCRAAGRNK